jgi:hypothetical protein
MNKTEIDVIWNRALREAIEGGEEFTRYRFAAMLTSAEREAWPCVIAEADFEQNTITLEMKCSDYKVGAGQHWLHTTPPAPQPVPVKTYYDGKPWPVAPKPWVGLTDAEVMQTMSGDWTSQFYFARAIEAKLREKNGGAA